MACQDLERHFKMPWNAMTSVNVAPIQFSDAENNEALKSHILDIRVAVLFLLWISLIISSK